MLANIVASKSASLILSSLYLHLYSSSCIKLCRFDDCKTGLLSSFGSRLRVLKILLLSWFPVDAILLEVNQFGGIYITYGSRISYEGRSSSTAWSSRQSVSQGCGSDGPVRPLGMKEAHGTPCSKFFCWWIPVPMVGKVDLWILHQKVAHPRGRMFPFVRCIFHQDVTVPGI